TSGCAISRSTQSRTVTPMRAPASTLPRDPSSRAVSSLAVRPNNPVTSRESDPVGRACLTPSLIANPPESGGISPRGSTPNSLRISIPPPPRYRACGPILREKPSCCLLCARPPNAGDRSSNCTRFPCRAKNVAADNPASPPPTTITSGFPSFDHINLWLLSTEPAYQRTNSNHNTFEPGERLQVEKPRIQESENPRSSYRLLLLG